MVRPFSEFSAKPMRADIRCILIAHAMRHESFVGNGHKVFRGRAVGAAKPKGVFTDRSLTFEPHVLQYNRITHKDPPFRTDNNRKYDPQESRC